MTKIKFDKIEAAERKIIFEDIAEKSSMPPFAVEKDWWVVKVLSIVFSMEIGNHLVFKGGTSLSKAWGLIERFSEDIDLAVDREFFGFGDKLTKKQRTKLRKASSNYISNIFAPELINRISTDKLSNLIVEVIAPETSDQDPRIVEIYYPSLFRDSKYIKPKIILEIGSRSMMEPNVVKTITSLVDLYSKNSHFFETETKIPVITPERTLLEKIFLLHEEFQRPIQKRRTDRLSRHLYDILQVSNNGFANLAFDNRELYNEIVEHRFHFTRLGGVDYNLHAPQFINPIPTNDTIVAWKKDYRKMQEEMIYGDSPSFDEMIKQIKDLIQILNNKKWLLNKKFPIISK